MPVVATVDRVPRVPTTIRFQSKKYAELLFNYILNRTAVYEKG